METKRVAGREGAQPDIGNIWQASDRASGPFRPTASRQPCAGAVERRTAQPGSAARFSRPSSHSTRTGLSRSALVVGLHPSLETR